MTPSSSHTPGSQANKAEHPFDLPQVVRDAGQGKTILLLRGRECGELFGRVVPESLPGCRLVEVELRSVTIEDWSSLLQQLLSRLETLGIRSCWVVADQVTSVIGQLLAIGRPKFVRGLVVIDPVTAPSPTLGERIAARLERFFPLGIPLRPQGRGFLTTPFLHRVRMPVAVVLTGSAPQGVERFPTAFMVTTTREHLEQILPQVITDLLAMPLRAPQRRNG